MTIAFDLGIDCNNIRVGVPHTMKDYCQEGRPGWKRWSFSQGRYLLQLLQYLQIRKNMSDEMKNFVQSKQCKRKMILSNFDHDMMSSTIMILPMCCDFHSRQGRCDDCDFAQALADIVVDIPQQQPSAVYLLQDQSGEELKETTFDADVNTQIKMDLIQYRVNLQRELGRSTVGHECGSFKSIFY